MTDLTLYTNPMSRGRIVRWMLEETGVAYDTTVVDYGPEMKSPDYLAINPMGKVPAIRHGDVVVTERLDHWDFDGNGWGLKLPCIGMFDVNEDGLISGWRDYFDNRMWFENGGPTLHLD